MDQEERDLRLKEQRTANRNLMIAAVALVVAFVSNIAGLYWSVTSFREQADINNRQFAATSRDSQYRSIVDGLKSGSAAVQTSSMLQLVDFVKDAKNFDGDAVKRSRGASNAIQTLAAFIEEESVATSRGLPDYESPQPVVLSRAMNQVKSLVSDDAIGKHQVDLSRASLHGLFLANFSPKGSLLAVGADFRRATLKSMDLTKLAINPHAEFSWSFLTCADLRGANFGSAALEGADLVGADLSGADLSHATGLREEQIAGAKIDRSTRLPFVADPRRGWGVSSRKCIEVVDAMTGMLPGQGYIRRLPCPVSPSSTTPPRFIGKKADLLLVCRSRQN
jgi:hypothetical protein